MTRRPGLTPISYYGGKMQMASRISAMLPMTKAYVEPFAGSAAVLLTRPRSANETLNDLNSEVYNFWKVLRDVPEELWDLLVYTPCSREELHECQGEVRYDLSDLERARRFFVLTNLSFNASTSGTAGYAPSNPTRHRGETFRRKVDSLKRVAERLRGVELENTDALALIDRWDHPDTAMYLDPPYLGSTRVGGTGDYATDNGGLVFHEKLIEQLRTFKGSAVLNGYPHPLYDSLGWLRVDIDRNAHSATTASGSTRRTECLWVQP